MRFLIGIGLLVASSSGVYPQHRGSFSAAAPTAGRPMPPTSAGRQVPSWGARPGAWGRPPFACWRYGRFNGQGAGIVPYVPYFVPYPAYSDGAYYGAYYPDIPNPSEQQFSQGVMTPQQPAPPVIINQYMADPSPAPPPADSTVRVYQVPASQPPEAAEPQRPNFFIALKDGWVYTATEYWVENGTLHYIAAHGRHNQVSLDLVDRQTSARLNHGREFQLPNP